VDYPADDHVLAVKLRDALRSEASKPSDAAARLGRFKTIARPRRARTSLSVHRLAPRLYCKLLERPAYLILAALAAGKPLASAITAGGRPVKPAQIQTWFATWMELGWF